MGCGVRKGGVSSLSLLLGGQEHQRLDPLAERLLKPKRTPVARQWSPSHKPPWTLSPSGTVQGLPGPGTEVRSGFSVNRAPDNHPLSPEVMWKGPPVFSLAALRVGAGTTGESKCLVRRLGAGEALECPRLPGRLGPPPRPWPPPSSDMSASKLC